MWGELFLHFNLRLNGEEIRDGEFRECATKFLKPPSEFRQLRAEDLKNYEAAVASAINDIEPKAIEHTKKVNERCLVLIAMANKSERATAAQSIKFQEPAPICAQLCQLP